MTQSTGDTPHVFPPASEAMLQWWNPQLIQGPMPLVRMQFAWLESLAEAMQFEAKCLRALAESGERMAGCYREEADPQALQACYQRLMQDVARTHWQRLEKVTELSEDFRKRLWEEI
ncbi:MULTISPECIES: hypothetical protein [Halomonas]|uniref:Phasin domain-containing protein n=1 Tax=Halomonas halophila TaxID=29573 RepID=A0ABQ0U0C5_9GAMM|nr:MULTISPECIES: hypothetical protein [Halomonas]MDR5888301.1 hypothetical protein [Halomonas salina]WJY08814.1 hypothetical protein QWG60_07910 [Halomonas halophila]GEK71832.1 hypothetical protein HHA04nite_03760 [Halomonas halophila]